MAQDCAIAAARDRMQEQGLRSTSEYPRFLENSLNVPFPMQHRNDL